MILISFFDKDVYMEQQIQDLIDSIRKEGLDKANSEKERIIDEAKAQRDEILRSAEEEKERIIKEAEKKAELLESSAKASIQQAARNASLSLRNEIESRITAILKAECRKALSLPELAGIIKAAVAADVSGKNNPMYGRTGDSAPSYVDGRSYYNAASYIGILLASGRKRECELCGSTERIHVHHKDGNHKNNDLL